MRPKIFFMALLAFALFLAAIIHLSKGLSTEKSLNKELSDELGRKKFDNQYLRQQLEAERQKGRL